MSKKSAKKSKSKVPTTGNDLFDFLLNKAGGQDAAVKAFAAERFKALAKGMTLRGAIDTADSEGWGDVLRSMTLGDLRGPKAPSKARLPRQPKGAANETRKAVQAFMGKVKGGKPSKDIAASLKMEPRVVARALAELVKAGQVKRTGSKRSSLYHKI